MAQFVESDDRTFVSVMQHVECISISDNSVDSGINVGVVRGAFFVIISEVINKRANNFRNN